MSKLGSLCLFASAVIFACGPASRPNNGDDVGGLPDAAEANCPDFPRGEDCADGLDNDCDGRADCADVDCSGVGSCPVCGMVDAPEAQPLVLPDGSEEGATCTTNAECTLATEPNCIFNQCNRSYESTLNFVGFPQGATLTDPAMFLSVCAEIEHSWLRDLQIDLITPDDRVITLHAFVDRTGNEIFLGTPYQADETGTPVPGTGAKYCWTAAAPLSMLDAPTMPVGFSEVLPGGDYKPITPFTAMTGTPLNGAWTLRVTDLWEIDNGFMFGWTIAFDPTLVNDCSGPIVL